MGADMATDTAPAETYSPSRQWQVPVFFLGLAALAAVAVGRPYLAQYSPNSPERLMQGVKDDLASDPPALDRVIDRTQKIVDQTDASPKLRGEAHFVLGTVLLKKAEGDPSEAMPLFQQAKHHLEQADRLGVPETDRVPLTVRLAKTWLVTNADPELAIRALSRVADTCADPFEAYGLLAEAQRRKQPQDFPALLEATRQQVARAPATADPAKLSQARLQLAELFLQAKNSRDARVVLMRLVSDAPPDVIYPARKMLARCHEEAQDWPSAAQTWAQLRDDPKLPAAEKARVLFALGRALFQNQRPDEAALAWQSAAAIGGPEAQAASLRLAELRCTTDPRVAMSALSDALAGVSAPETYKNELIPLDDLRAIFGRCSEQLRNRGEFEPAVELSKLYAKVAAPGRAMVQQAEATAAWADDLTKKGQPAATQLTEAARQYLTAATATPNSTDAANWLWHAADLAQKAPDNALALDALNRYVQLESIVGPERVAAELYTIGAVQERAKNLAEARTAYQKSAATPNAFRFKARYALARFDLADARQDEEIRQNPKLDDADRMIHELRAKLKFDDAEKMLQDNLSELRQAAQPDPGVQELTVYGLADIAYERGDYAMADPRLRGALQEYPQSANAIRARNQLALCIWRKAIEEFRTLSNEKIPEAQRQRTQKELVDSLKQSADQFALVEKALMDRPLDSLSATDRECLIKAAFSVGDVQCVAGLYQEALARYEELVKRFAGTIYELHAIRQVWHCHYYYFKDDAKAIDQLSRLRDAMDKLPETAFDGRSDMHQRNYWIEKIVEMGKSMNK
jgi:tetratricopeptide (TPR) repeat protein